MGRGGGGGGLRILPHKSWNVYGYDNIQKVKADEAKHAEEEAIKAAGLRRNEAEYRLDRMRNQAAKRGRTREESLEDDDTNINHDSNEMISEGGDETETGVNEGEAVSSHKRRRFLESTATVASSSTTTAATRSSTNPRVRYVIQQQEVSTESSATTESNEIDSATAAPLAQPQHINLFTDVPGTNKAAEIARIKAADARKKELEYTRRVAPVSLFVESLRDAESGTNSLRPWYNTSEEERRAMELREIEAKKKKVTFRRKPNGGVQLVMNPTGEVRHSVVDPLDEMQLHLQRLKQHEQKNQVGPAEKEVNQQLPAGYADYAASNRLVHQQQPFPLTIQRQSSTDSLPSLQPQSMWNSTTTPSNANLTSPPPLLGSTSPTVTSSNRRTRWSESLQSMHFNPVVGFTNSTEIPMLPRESTATTSVLTHHRPRDSSTVSTSSSSSSASSTSSSSSSESDDSSSHHRRHRHRHKSHKHHKHDKRHKSSSSSKKKKKKESKRDSSKKSKKEKKKKSHHRHSRSSSPDRSSSPNRLVTSSIPHLSTPPGSHLTTCHLKTTDELRRERAAREAIEREKAAGLLQVPIWATNDERSVTQLYMKDEVTERRSGYGYQR